MSSERAEQLLDARYERALSAEESRLLQQYLDTCESSAELAAGDEALRQATAQLPREVQPPAELWAGIADRLTERSTASGSGTEFAVGGALDGASVTHARTEPQVDSGRVVHGRFARTVESRPWLLALAALLLMGLGGLLSQWLWPSVARDGAQLADDPGVETSDIALARHSNGERDFAAVEASYLRSKEELRRVADEAADRISPVRRKVIERNLEIIDEAIAEIRVALKEDPGNERLQELLLANHSKEIHLLRRLARADRT